MTREREAHAARQLQDEAQLDEMRDQAQFGALRRLGRAAMPGWFLKYGLSSRQAYELNCYGLEAKYAQRIGRHSVAWFTDTFALDYDGYPAALALVTSPKNCDVSLLYKSNSRAVWRWAPATADDGWLSKGEFPEAMNLPFELQATLGYIDDHTRERSQPSGGYVPIEFNRAIVPEIARGKTKTLPLGARQFQQLPDAFNLDYTTEAQSPDFSKQQGNIVLHDARRLYGEAVILERYPSHDGHREYVFAHSQGGGHAWLSGVHPTSGKIRRQGLVYDAAMPGVELTRPYQYLGDRGVASPCEGDFSDVYGLQNGDQKQLVKDYARILQQRTAQ